MISDNKRKMTLDINYFKEKLLAEKKHLETELSSVAQQGHKDKNDWQARGTLNDDSVDADPNEVADKIEEYETNYGIVDNLKSNLAEVINALTKIDAGTYGICEVSGDPIEEDRLMANPAARTCKLHINAK